MDEQEVPARHADTGVDYWFELEGPIVGRIKHQSTTDEI
jgi:uncharacterized protein YaeQ